MPLYDRHMYRKKVTIYNLENYRIDSFIDTLVEYRYIYHIHYMVYLKEVVNLMKVKIVLYMV